MFTHIPPLSPIHNVDMMILSWVTNSTIVNRKDGISVKNMSGKMHVCDTTKWRSFLANYKLVVSGV
jgi:hypothetical protein